MTGWQPYAKALVGAAAAGLGVLATSTEGGISLAETLSAVVAALVALGAVFATPNRDPAAQHQDESVQPPAGRHADDGDPSDGEPDLDVIPAAQATSDTKADAAHL